ncbi:hypothetical protein HCA58_22500 [Micromonospora sp. HNM0581]|uniref:hypothetical protein n=1 Tax=Micromonospora sp. HNM0581 TaxID=2716341 RepID=UPI00146DF380|nr:hypothetical protein [Micromonospora sp. HNM0581]NLU81064.1 hypothetical protein [Micromonospora sp. HNM0581]
MADETRIDPDGLRPLLRRVGEIGESLAVAANAVTGIRAEVPQPWGDDKNGKNFADNNEEKANGVLTGLQDQIPIIREFVDVGLDSVDNFVALDEANAHGLDR